MKVSKAQALDNRAAILQAASAQIRERGFDHMSVTDVAHSAGLTHGALYSHFDSKDALQAEAIRCAFDECVQAFTGLTPSKFVKRYLSVQHRDNPQKGCPTSALISEIRWQSPQSKEVFSDGMERFAALAAESLKEAGAEHGHDRALLMFSAMVGGLALSRAVRDVDKIGSDKLLLAVANQLSAILEEPSTMTARKRTGGSPKS